MDAKLDMFEDVNTSPSPSLEGDMSIPGKRTTTTTSQNGVPDYNTLDEPIKETVLRDIRAVGVKFYHVLYPKEKSSLLRDWDLWGPLVLCTFMATILQGSSSADSMSDNGPEFAQVFVIVWIGAAIVTLNSKLLGGNISFFQSVCVLGYCLTPVAISLIVCRIILLSTQTRLLFFLRFVTTTMGFAWATYASFIFLGQSQPPHRKPLAVYPIFLFFFIISWLVLSHN
ncbi:GL15435 [Drosophila persimilis]|uniref:Protein YIPF n=2 Tax=pseudoobscura subgroup TaxID=32358 RepID=Q29LJ2_DROPS|nr:protein YIPF6 [Drosophila pseudoobscura]XP_002020639.1 protein YIPF6 [Drosophila persimilis]XP_017154148.1 protein YIPF6 [Drosophila miranda]EDW39632.1 GL15435 [Drosophila persimilis]